MRWIVAFAALVTIVAGVATAASAQTAGATRRSPDAAVLGASMAHYYEKPFDILEFVSQWERLPGVRPEGLVGFLAGIATKQSSLVKPLVTAKLEPRTQAAVVEGLRLGGRVTEARAAAQSWGWPADKMAQITELPPLTGMRAQSAGQLDAMWGAFFATGDTAYVRPILNFYVFTATRRDVDAQDIVEIAKAHYRRSADGNEKVKAIAGKYPQDVFIRMVHASSALWSLASNSSQHTRVAKELDQYTQAQPDSPAFKGLKELREMRAPSRAP